MDRPSRHYMHGGGIKDKPDYRLLLFQFWIFRTKQKSSLILYV